MSSTNKNINNNKKYTIPTCSNDGKRLNKNGITLYDTYKNFDKDDKIICYANDRSIPLYSQKLNNINNAIFHRNNFTNICIEPGHNDQGHIQRIRRLEGQYANCEKQIMKEHIRMTQEANKLIIESYINNNRKDHIGFVLTTNNVDYATLNRLNSYLKRKGLIQNNFRNFSYKIDAINKYFDNVNEVVMIGTVPIVLSKSRSNKTSSSGNTSTKPTGTNTTRSTSKKSTNSRSRKIRPKSNH